MGSLCEYSKKHCNLQCFFEYFSVEFSYYKKDPESYCDEAEGDDHTTLCVRCFENNYTTCESCGRIIHCDDAEYSDDDYPYCYICYDKIRNHPIKAYNYKPEPIFYGSGNLFMG